MRFFRSLFDYGLLMKMVTEIALRAVRPDITPKLMRDILCRAPVCQQDGRHAMSNSNVNGATDSVAESNIFSARTLTAYMAREPRRNS